MVWFGKTTLLVYCEKIVVLYKIYCENDNDCEIELNLYHPFNRHRAFLSNILKIKLIRRVNNEHRY